MKKFIYFLIVGGIAALLNWSSRFLFSIWYDFEIAIVLAFVIGLTSGFIMMRWLVFDAREKSLSRQVPMYLLINSLALVQTWVVSVGLARWILPATGFSRDPEAIAHLVGVLVPVLTSYFGHKLLTFR